MKLAVVGSREGADLEHLGSFLAALADTHPGTVVVSGGAVGVDSAAEQDWRSRGYPVVSFRAKQFENYWGQEEYGIERWELNDDRPRTLNLYNLPTFADYKSALVYRDMLIAQECDRLVAFMRKGGSRGSQTTIQFAENEGRPVTRFEA